MCVRGCEKEKSVSMWKKGRERESLRKRKREKERERERESLPTCAREIENA